MTPSFDKLASKTTVTKTIHALKTNGISAIYVKTKEEAKEKALALIPKKAEVMTMQSVTLQAVGIFDAIDESGDYMSVRTKLKSMDRKTQGKEMQELGAAPEYTIGSVHAVTEDGKVLVASNTGSQMAAYVYGSSHVVWIVGTQKIVKDSDEGIKRIYDYCLPRESERFRKAYNLPESSHSNVSKLLIFNKEVKEERIHIIFVDEMLGF